MTKIGIMILMDMNKVREAIIQMTEGEADWTTAMRLSRNRPDWGDMRQMATDWLIERGSTEVGTSDINHALFAIYKAYGGNYDDALSDWRAMRS
jgi:hypothetical protein